MNPPLVNLLDAAGAIYLQWWLLAAAIVLILIDAFFPTDWPARLGYFLAAAGLFFLIPMSPLGSLVVALLIWAGLELAHRLVWGELLRNAPPPAASDLSTDPRSTPPGTGDH